MKYNKGLSLIKLFFFVFLVLVIAFTFTYFSGKDGMRILVNNLNSFLSGKKIINVDPKIFNLKVNGNNFIVKSRSLTKVEIFYQLENTDPSKVSDIFVSESKKFSELFLRQKFKLPITCGPFSPIKVYVKGYNEKEEILDSVANLDIDKDKYFYLDICPKDEKLNIKDGYFITDSKTELNIKSYLISFNGEEFNNTIAFAKYAKALPDGVYNLSISSEGYKDLKDIKLFLPGGLTNSVIALEPLDSKNNIPSLEKNKIRIYGYVADEIHNPIPKVLVTLHNYNLITYTNENGFYYLDIIPDTADLCTSNTISYEKKGYQKNTITDFGSGYIKTGFENTSIDSSVVLKKGDGEYIVNQKYHLCP